MSELTEDYSDDFKGYIYFLKTITYPEFRKIGSTKYPLNRYQSFSTLHINKKDYGFEKIYKIKSGNFNCYEIDEYLKTTDKLNHFYNDSGEEWYKYSDDIFDNFESILRHLNVDFEIIIFEKLITKTYEKMSRKKKYQIELKEEEEKEIAKETFKRNLNILRLKPFDMRRDQIELENKLDIMRKNKIATLIWPCGMGKTVASLIIGEKLIINSILICVPSVYILTQFRDNIIEFTGINPICYYGESNNKHLLTQEYFTSDKVKIILSTYHSCKKILDITIKYNFQFDFKVGDEAHHLVSIVKTDDKDTFEKFHYINSKFTLFMTATIKTFDSETFRIFDMKNKKQFGEIIDKKTIRYAIKSKLITDYKILTLTNTSDEINIVMNKIEFDVISRDPKLTFDKTELFMAAYYGLKSIEDGLTTHILIYTNTTNSSDIIKQVINILLTKNLFTKVTKDNLYNEALYSQTKSDLNIFDDDPLKSLSEMSKFNQSKFGIISCVYIFGEGVDIPKLNGVVIGENMSTEIRIVQSCLRANRLDDSQPNKTSYIMIPTNINGINKKLKDVVKHMGKEDSDIEQKIKVIKCNSKSSSICNIYHKEVELNIDKQKTALLTYKLYNSDLFDCGISLEKQYEYNKKLLQTKNYKSVDDYLKDNFEDKIDNPPVHFHGIWTNWFDYLSIEFSQWIKNKNEWKTFCKELNINNIEEYYEMVKVHKNLPPEPEYFYNYDTSSNLSYELDFEEDDSYLFE